MKHQTKLSQEQQNTEAHQTHETQQQAAKEFATAEELLRFDAAHTVMPPGIAKRLEESMGKAAPAPRRPWWKSLLGQ
jgi:hypothetical protein